MRTPLLRIYGLLLMLFAVTSAYGQENGFKISFEYYNHTFNLDIDSSVIVPKITTLSEQQIKSQYNQVNMGRFEAITDSLTDFKEKHQLNDWLYYQLVRKTAEQISPKKENYERYTFYKWFLMVKSGFDARLTIADGRIIFYVYQ